MRGLQRDVHETAFTPLLDRICAISEQIDAVALVDLGGECVDYCSVLEPHDTRIFAAHLSLLMAQVRAATLRLALVTPRVMKIKTSLKELWVMRATPAYVVVVMCDPSVNSAELLAAIEMVMPDLRDEMGAEHFSVHGLLAKAEVDVAGDMTKNYKPARFREQGQLYQISEVLGSWQEGLPEFTVPRRGFRVRTTHGLELNLVHDLEQNQWYCEL